MAIELQWNGPLKVGNLPKNKKECRERGFLNPGVYLYFQEYPEFFVMYAGKTGFLLERIRQHFTGFLGLHYWLRINNPTIRPEIVPVNYDWTKEFDLTNSGYGHLSPFNKLSENLIYAEREVRKLHFFFCPYWDNDLSLPLGVKKKKNISEKDFIKWTEGLLVSYLKRNERTTTVSFNGGDAKPWFCDNERRPISERRLKTQQPKEFSGIKLVSSKCPEFLQQVFLIERQNPVEED